MTDPLTAAKWLGDPSVDIEAARRCLPADEPAPGLELDVSEAGIRHAFARGGNTTVAMRGYLYPDDSSRCAAM